MGSIAIVGMACRYADARSPRELWENVLARRRSFRRIPRVRLNLDDYLAGPNNDFITATMAAVLEDYEFDRSHFHVSRDAFLSTDLSHWLALDVATQALSDARLIGAPEKQREKTAVYVGNSLTGEFSRANLMRLRWPYVRRVLAAALQDNGGCRGDEFIARIEELYKAPFPATNEESLAGGLSNTIAGRICNYFDFKGGGYTVDGACASSLLAVATACSALAGGEVEVAVAGGVDLSLDPFELAGFSSLGAIAAEKMRVFDVRSSGFWPGEGCGMLVLMRLEDAMARRYVPYAVIRGWGISSDGRGGITRPEPAGQLLAIQRAYDRSHYDIGSVGFFEGHGTGTAVGDAAELQALSRALRESSRGRNRAAISSVKANIGHTKAAAGVAGLIKAAMALNHGIIPPATGCDEPHPELTGDGAVLYAPPEPELWPGDLWPRAGISAFGFGGINVHVTLEASQPAPRSQLSCSEIQQSSSAQDCELFLFSAVDRTALASQLRRLRDLADECSYSELVDLSIVLARDAECLGSQGRVRAACVASSPQELSAAISRLLELCDSPAGLKLDARNGLFWGQPASHPKIGYLFPGQASPVYTGGGAWSRRFPSLHDVYRRANLPPMASAETRVAQPCIAAASLAGLHVLELFGLHGSVAVGHSLGEITALHWAGACDVDGLLGVVRARGNVMQEKAEGGGAMASVAAGYPDVLHSINGDRVVVAAHNAPLQTVVSGEAGAVKRFTERLACRGIATTMLPVSHAFHSPLVAGAATAFAEELAGRDFTPLRHCIVSSVTAEPLQSDVDVAALLIRQITAPVRFADAVRKASEQVDLFVEVGPGSVLSGLAAECTEKPAVPLDSGGSSLQGLLSTLAAAFVLGAPLRLSPLHERFGRRIDISRRHSFLANPCEAAPAVGAGQKPAPRPAPAMTPPRGQTASSATQVLRELIAARTQLPLDAIALEARLLGELHLNSITISQIILETAAQLSIPAPVAPGEYTNATIAEAASALEALRSHTPKPESKLPMGVDQWTRSLDVELVEAPLPPARDHDPGEWRIISSANNSADNRSREAIHHAGEKGIVCMVPGERDEAAAQWLLQTAQDIRKKGVERIVFVQERGGASALARSLFLEYPDLNISVINVPPAHPAALAWALAEARACRGFSEAFYDDRGVRREPRLTLLWPDTAAHGLPLGPGDVLLVTGGGKGIAAECGLRLAQLSGCRLVLLGRSDPTRDPELKRNLLRFEEAGITFEYSRVDLEDPDALSGLVQRIEARIGHITALMHGAGTNIPKRLADLTPMDLHQVFAPKVTGLENLLGQLDPGRLRLLITFGSIIARTGLHGEAHYGLANEWLRLALERRRKAHPACRCVNLEWSVWAGIGMGQRLGVLDSLARQGITPLPVDAAIEQLLAITKLEQPPVSPIITGRFGSLPTVKFSRQELPLHRFLERVQLHVPGIEIVADSEISALSDPYIVEHEFQGELLLPAVMGMEAMAQVAAALERTEALPSFRNISFSHPIVVPKDRPVTVRLAALRRQPGIVLVVVRCSTTSFQVDHFSGTCVFGEDIVENKDICPREGGKGALRFYPASALYRSILFQRGRFQRIESYSELHARKSLAHLTAPAGRPWFARHLPSRLLIGDAASRDAALHSIQACIPHKTVLPTGVDRVIAAADWTGAPAVIHATEKLRDGDNFVYDLLIEDTAGNAREEWRGLRLRAVAPIQTGQSWPLFLLVPYLERRLADLLPHGACSVALAQTEEGRTPAVERELRRRFGPDAELCHRPDGRPETAPLNGSGPHISISHCGGVSLLVTAGWPIGCDLERVCSVGAREWELLLGEEGMALARSIIAASDATGEQACASAWALKESLRKAGAAIGTLLPVQSGTRDGWTRFSSGSWSAATFCADIGETGSPVAFGFVIANAP